MFVLLAVVFGLGFVFLGIGSGSNGITRRAPERVQLRPREQRHVDLEPAEEDAEEPAERPGVARPRDGLRGEAADERRDRGAHPVRRAEGQGLERARGARERVHPAGERRTRPTTRTPRAAAAAFTPPAPAFPPTADARRSARRSTTRTRSRTRSRPQFQQQAQTDVQTALSNYSTAQSNAEQAYQKIVKLTPNDANARLQLGQAAAGGERPESGARRIREVPEARAERPAGAERPHAGQAAEAAACHLPPRQDEKK